MLKLFKKTIVNEKVRKEVRIKTVGYILAAFGLVAGLAWNDAIKSLIEQLFPLDKDSIWVKFIYAAIITIIAVMISIYLVKFAEEKEND